MAFQLFVNDSRGVTMTFVLFNSTGEFVGRDIETGSIEVILQLASDEKV